MIEPTAFIDAVDEQLFGGKCVSLGRALRAGLPAPDGFALSVELVRIIATGNTMAFPEIEALFTKLAPALAVRSSAIGEDSSAASFAGQHLSVLNVMSIEHMMLAIRKVYESAHRPEALAYRHRMGVSGEPAIAVALQRQIASEVSGVMFTRNPQSGESERYIEASWGLGEAIVAGLVVPDSFRLSAAGAIIARSAGEKDLMIVADTASGTAVEVAVDDDKITALCLNDAQLSKLHKLAGACELVYGDGLDIEWAFFQDELYLLQCRAITR